MVFERPLRPQRRIFIEWRRPGRFNPFGGSGFSSPVTLTIYIIMYFASGAERSGSPTREKGGKRERERERERETCRMLECVECVLDDAREIPSLRRCVITIRFIIDRNPYGSPSLPAEISPRHGLVSRERELFRTGDRRIIRDSAVFKLARNASALSARVEFKVARI